MTVAPPLSAGLMIMSVLLLSLNKAALSRLVRLLRGDRRLCKVSSLISCLNLSIYVLRYGSLEGPVYTLRSFWFNFWRIDGWYPGPSITSSIFSGVWYSLRVSLRAKVSMFLLMSHFPGGGGVGQKLSPLRRMFVSDCVSWMSDKFTVRLFKIFSIYVDLSRVISLGLSLLIVIYIYIYIATPSDLTRVVSSKSCQSAQTR